VVRPTKEFVSSKPPSGTPFENEVSRSLAMLRRYFGIAYKKLFDTAAYRGRLLCPACGARIHSPFIAGTTIADHVVFTLTDVVFLEEKLFTTPTFPLKRITKDQLWWSRRIWLNQAAETAPPARYYFLINDRRRPRHFRAWALDYGSLRDAVMYEGKLVLSPEALETHGTELRRLKGMKWDLFDLLGLCHVSQEERDRYADRFEHEPPLSPEGDSKMVWKELRMAAKEGRRGRGRR